MEGLVALTHLFPRPLQGLHVCRGGGLLPLVGTHRVGSGAVLPQGHHRGVWLLCWPPCVDLTASPWVLQTTMHGSSWCPGVHLLLQTTMHGVLGSICSLQTTMHGLQGSLCSCRPPCMET